MLINNFRRLSYELYLSLIHISYKDTVHGRHRNHRILGQRENNGGKGAVWGAAVHNGRFYQLIGNEAVKADKQHDGQGQRKSHLGQDQRKAGVEYVHPAVKDKQGNQGCLLYTSRYV